MIKRVSWQQVDVKKTNLASYLTVGNFQPGQFEVVPHMYDPGLVVVVFVERSR